MEKQELMSLVLLDGPLSPDLNTVAAAIGARHPDIPVSVPGVGAGQSLIVCGGKIIAIMSMPAPAPTDEGVQREPRRPGRR